MKGDKLMGTIIWEPQRDGSIKIDGLVSERDRRMLDMERVIEGGYKEIEEVKGKLSKKKYERLKKYYIVASGALLLMLVPHNVYAATSSISAIEQLGNTIIGGVQRLAVFIVTTMCLFDAIKAIMENEPKRIPGSAVKFAIGLFIIYAVPELFFLMRDHFDKVGVVNGGPGIFNQSVPVNAGG